MNGPDTTQDSDTQGPNTPQGTIALLLLYLVIVVGLWGSVFLTMLSRGVNQ
jgi:hypothetical protein